MVARLGHYRADEGTQPRALNGSCEGFTKTVARSDGYAPRRVERSVLMEEDMSYWSGGQFVDVLENFRRIAPPHHKATTVGSRCREVAVGETIPTTTSRAY